MLKTDKNSVILALLIMTQPFLDILSYFAIEMNLTAVSSALRLAIFGAIMLYAFLLSDRKKAYLIFAGVLAVYWLIHMLVCMRDGYSMVSDINGFLRTIQMPALVLALVTLFKNSKHFPEQVGRFFIANYIIIAASIVLSYVLDMPVPTYAVTNIGVKGWFATSNSQSYIVSAMAMLALYASYREKNNVLFILTMVLAFVQMFLIGTLVALYSIFITAISFLVIMLWNREKRWVMASALVLAMVATVLALPLSASRQVQQAEQIALERWEGVLEEQEQEKEEEQIPEKPTLKLAGTILSDMEERFGYEKVLEVYGGHIDAEELMDARLKKINFGRLAMAEGDVLTLLFGLEDADMIFKEETYDPENDFPAVFFFYGIVGVVLYVAFLGYFAWILGKDIVKSLKKLPVEKTILALSLVLSLGCAEMSANVLRRPNASIYISLMLAYAYYVCKVKKEPNYESEPDHSGI